MKLYFEGLRNNPTALLYNTFYFIKQIAYIIPTILLIISAKSYLLYEFKVLYVICFIAILFIEIWWLYYLLITWPYKTYSENRIIIINQFIVLILIIWGLVTSILSSELQSNESILDIMEYIHIIWFMPTSYLLFMIHYLSLKILYIK